MLYWTNPPDSDLDAIVFYAVHVVENRPDTLLTGPFPGRGDTLSTPERIVVPGAPDSVLFTVPCSSTPQEWEFYAKALDVAGNPSPKSNSATWTGTGRE